jgi:ankyrin repeat protein
MGSSHELPARANLEHLKNEAKQRLKELRRPRRRRAAQRRSAAGRAPVRIPELAAAQGRGRRPRALARLRGRARGRRAAVRRALEHGFNPGTSDADGRSLHQLAKILGHAELELLMRDYQERDDRSAPVKRAVGAIQSAAADGRLDELRELLDEHPDLLDARGLDFNKQTALHKAAWKNRLACVQLLLDRGADARIRDYGDNAYALHFAAEAAELAIVRMLVEAGSDVVGEGDDHQVGVLGWATCLGHVREDVAQYLLSVGAELSIWSAIALDRGDDVRRFVKQDPAILSARSSRNEHHRTPLHHAAAVNRPAMVRLLLELGAQVDAVDDAGRTALTVAAVEKADPSILTMLERAGARLDLLTAITLGRYEIAERMVAEDPARIGPDGRDTIALHLLVAKRNEQGVRWLIAHWRGRERQALAVGVQFHRGCT